MRKPQFKPGQVAYDESNGCYVQVEARGPWGRYWDVIHLCHDRRGARYAAGPKQLRHLTAKECGRE